MAAARRLDIGLIGTFSLQLGNVDVRFPGRKACALMSYLALSDGHASSRETLLGLLWSSSPESKARASLRQVVHEIHETLAEAGYSGFHADRLMLRLSPESVSVDVLEAQQLAGEGVAHPKLLCKQHALQTLLPDLADTDPAFAEWLTVKRQSLHEQTIGQLAMRCRSLAPGSTCMELSRAILNLEPSHEEAVRNIMRSSVVLGDAAGALRVYKSLWDTLEKEFDVEPTKKTQELVAAIKLGQTIDVAAVESENIVIVGQCDRRQFTDQLENLVRSIISRFGGRLSAREGTAFVLDFPDPRAAVQAAFGMTASPGSTWHR